MAINISRTWLCSVVTAVSIAASFASFHVQAAQDEIPPGYFRMPDGRIMANNPATAIAPPGYYLRKNGVLIKVDTNPGEPVSTPTIKPGEVPPGFHRMPDGRIMANNPSTAVAPAGYHLMQDGTLMSNSGGDHSGHAGHHGHSGHHGAGMIMFDYVYTRMNMKDLLDTTTRLSPEQMFEAPYPYHMTPIDMTMDMHMFMAMYGVTDKIMLMFMGHYMSNYMNMLSINHADGSTVKSVMKSEGIADTVVSTMVQLPFGFTLDFGLSLPTGSIDVRGPMTHAPGAVSDNDKYPYGMQLGSGTLDLKPGLRYAGNMDMFSWGADFEYTYRLQKNKNDYKLGDQILAGVWLGLTPQPFVTAKAKLKGKHLGQITGADSVLDINMSPSMNPNSQGGIRIDAGGEVKFNTPGQMYSGGFEFLLPVYQNLWGPQMATSWIASFKLGVMF